MSEDSKAANAVYKHYKGGMYRLLAVVRHSETLEELVLYEALYENNLGQLWVRPKEMFFSQIIVNGEFVARFELQPEEPST
jgi:hypothetical protein